VSRNVSFPVAGREKKRVLPYFFRLSRRRKGRKRMAISLGKISSKRKGRTSSFFSTNQRKKKGGTDSPPFLTEMKAGGSRLYFIYSEREALGKGEGRRGEGVKYASPATACPVKKKEKEGVVARSILFCVVQRGKGRGAGPLNSPSAGGKEGPCYILRKKRGERSSRSDSHKGGESHAAATGERTHAYQGKEGERGP